MSRYRKALSEGLVMVGLTLAILAILASLVLVTITAWKGSEAIAQHGVTK